MYRSACVLAVVGLLALTGEALAQGPVTLAAGHLGVPLSAPPPPTVEGQPASTVSYEWQRCLPFSTLVSADGATNYWHVGEGDSAAVFDGKTRALAVAGAPDYAGTEPYTLELWVRPRTIDGTYRFLISREETTSAGRQGTGIWLSSTGLGFERWINGVAQTVHYTAGLPVGSWSHVTATYDGTIMRLYVNGAQVGSRETSATLIAQAAGSTTIGAGAGGRSGFFAGGIDQGALYSRAIIRSHVSAHEAAATNAPCTPISGAAGPTYTPVSADLGRTLSVTVTSTDSHGSATVLGQGAGPVDDGHGNYVQAAIGGLSANGTASGMVQVTATLAGLPADRVEWDVDGQYRYAKPGEPPYQYTWYTAAEANGPHTVTVKVWGPDAPTPVSSEVMVHVANPTLHPTPLAFGEESMYAELDEGEEASAQDLLGNVWPARGLPLPYLEWPLTWQEDPYHEAYWEFYFYGLRPEATLLYEWEKNGDERLPGKADRDSAFLCRL